MNGQLEIVVDPAVEQLLRRTVATFERADLDEPMTRLSRLLERRQLLELEATSTDQGCWRVRLRPFVELALREAIDVAGDGRLDRATRSKRVMETFALCGL